MIERPRRPPGRLRRGAWWLVPPVLLLHLALVDRLAPDRLGAGAGTALPERIAVAFVRELQPAPPPRVLVPRLRPAAPRVAALPAPAASAAAVPPPELPPLPFAPSELVQAPPEVEPRGPMPAPETQIAAPAAAPAFDWPPSTRLSYRVTGHYRGPVDGQARVEWLMRGTRYQVHLELSIGPPFAPVATRRLSSDGEVTPAGLEPHRYDEETTAVLREPRRLAIVFDPARVLLPGGRSVPRPSGVQDSASQFVQMVWLVTTRPELLEPGRAIELPLALPRQVDAWVYDVVGPELLATPLGEVQAVHIRPRREPRAGGDLVAELWLAPTLQNLPVRIVIRADAQTHVDLQLERLPQQAAR